MKSHKRKTFWRLATLPTLILLATQLHASEYPEFSAEEYWFDTSGSQVDIVTPFEFQSIELRIRKRGETEVWTETFGPGVSLSADLSQIVRSGLTDDRYTYEIRFVTGYKAGDSAELEAGAAGEPITFSTSGSFSVEQGSIADVTIPGYRAPGSVKGESGTISSDSNLEASGDPTPMDLSDVGDLAIGGYGIFGSSNTADVVGGKVRVLASNGIASLSVQAEATNGDVYAWHFGTQDGGDFGLQRQRTSLGAKTTVLGIEEDAAANSLMIASNGNIGIGTATPVDDLHISGGDMTITDGTPFITFENTSGDVDWQVGESSDDFRIIQSGGIGSGSKFSIEEGGNIGMGTTAPTTPLHVRRTDNTAQVRVEDSGVGNQTMFSLSNQGAPIFDMSDDAQNGVKWEFAVAGTKNVNERFQISKVGSGQLEFRLNADGSAQFAGNVTANGVLLTSTREAKTDFAPLDEREILEKLASLDISQWRYKNESEDTRHIGPVAEEFHEIFGLSDGKTLNMIDTNGITFAAIKALNEQNIRITATNEELAEENRNLKARLERLEEAVGL